MYRIYLDLSKRHDHVVVLIKDGIEIDRVMGDFDGFEMLLEVCIKHSVPINEIESIDYFAGPGSFTGLKISAAISNIFNWARGTKITELKYPLYGREPNITMSDKNS